MYAAILDNKPFQERKYISLINMTPVFCKSLMQAKKVMKSGG